MLLRGILSILAGLAVTIVVIVVFTWMMAALTQIPTNQPTPAYNTFIVIINAMAGLVGGLLTGKLAPTSPFMHTVGLAATIFLLGLPMIIAGPLHGQPDWYPAAIAVSGAAMALVGGWLAKRSEGRATDAEGI
ncbi:MAG: hypothetical protein ACOCTG_02370 [Bacteroidota bacterium]